MPHLHLEYTDNLPQLNADSILQRLNHALVASGQFGNEADIKSRAVKLECFRVGTRPEERAFIHVKLAILSGRSPEVKKQVSESLLAVLTESLQWPEALEIQLCVEVLDIDRDSYTKTSFIGSGA
ncbi:5-carboxymethyl-2-hydroxymuconate Delta-isomerase [Pseudomonas sp. R5(2019)]|uniref:5-carboxymethyl-2-hydroxymuconate Delta-isomerase n=1 Tax=Pseudomonas sp. R5(2019) TaxID=2697566 RepID=UPI001412BF3B|nr:5-carboxymethyl-2-hydroxymuconate Delta-isomerase [Pseudomonas sp. R5(2019)]NBA95863.1 5-carboxymethyl-2-hydroxymuconate isomerase [Pseudomonas sp. R5(2019)]